MFSKLFNRLSLLLVGFLMLAGPTHLSAQDEPPGVVIAVSPKPETLYIGETSMTILPNGKYVAIHGFWYTKEKRATTAVYLSDDRGKSWKRVSIIKDQYWSTVFSVGESLYVMGTSYFWSPMIIRRSDDEGKTWTTPSDSKSGLLTRDKHYRATPVAMPILHGRIWRAVEKAEDNNHNAFAMSASLDADLLDASSWKSSTKVTIPKDHFGGTKDRLNDGSIVPGPDSSLFSLMTISEVDSKMAMMQLSKDGNNLEFDIDSGFIEFPTTRKTIIRFDPKSKRYWALARKTAAPYALNNVMSLVSSADLVNWKTETILLQHFEGFRHGFHKPFWHFDGDDIVTVVGTGWGFGHGSHMTFHRFKNFRDLKMEDSAPVLGAVRENFFQNKDFILRGTMKVLPFRNGDIAFSNWGFRLKDIPDDFENWSYTQLSAASQNRLNLRGKRDCEVYFAAGIHGGKVDVTDWTLVDGKSFAYTHKDERKILIFKRTVKEDEMIEIPQGTWSGGMVLIPPNQ